MLLVADIGTETGTAGAGAGTGTGVWFGCILCSLCLHNW